MKLYLLLFLLAGTVTLVSAQQSKPYLAIIKTTSGTARGILYKVDSTYLLIDSKTGLTSIDAGKIEAIKLRLVQKKYKVKKLFTYKPYDDINYDKDVNGFQVRKWGKADPSLKEEFNGHAGNAMLNVAANIIAFPFHFVNPYVAKVKFKELNRYNQSMEMLANYSVYYQQNPNLEKELKQLSNSGK